MIPGEMITVDGDLELNAGRRLTRLTVANTGDRPIQVGSHYHFAETNPALRFDRALARGCRLDIPAGTAVRFEPGQEREVELVDYAGAREVYGFRAEIMGPLEVTVHSPRPLAGEGLGERAGASTADPLSLTLSPLPGGEGTERLPLEKQP